MQLWAGPNNFLHSCTRGLRPHNSSWKSDRKSRIFHIFPSPDSVRISHFSSLLFLTTLMIDWQIQLNPIISRRIFDRRNCSVIARGADFFQPGEFLQDTVGGRFRRFWRWVPSFLSQKSPKVWWWKQVRILTLGFGLRGGCAPLDPLLFIYPNLPSSHNPACNGFPFVVQCSSNIFQ